jgi:hypothetical protein
MDSTSACGSSSNVGDLYAVAMAKRSQDQTRIDGESAVRLIETAAQQPAPLPPDATVSVRA